MAESGIVLAWRRRDMAARAGPEARARRGPSGIVRWARGPRQARLEPLLRDREPLLRRSYPNEPTYQGYPEGGAARDPVPKAASARRCCSCSSEPCLLLLF